MAALLFRRERFRFLSKRAVFKHFSQVITASFDSIPLNKRLVDRLASFNLINPTEIQQKCLDPILDGKNVIVNSETGSGKTLCYLLPIINSQLMENNVKNNKPSALILVPNMHLGFQIAEVFNKLCDPGTYACPVSRDMPLRISNKYPVIISTVNTITQYSLPLLLPALKTVVIDEADMIIANSRKTVWKLLNTLKNPVLNHSITKRQFIFVAATMPTRGEKSVSREIAKWLPGILHVKSNNVHRYVPTVEKINVELNDNEKMPNLEKCLDNIFKNSLVDKRQPAKVLVFVNTTFQAKKVCDFLNSGADDVSETDSKKYRTSSAWDGKVGVLYKDLKLSQRQVVLEEFKEAKLDVLVTTDLGSRGLDIPCVSHVIQMDYAQNAVDVLHRAGRTARAGALGTVISFVTEKDKHLLEAVQKSEHECEGFQNIFSRNRMFSKRINKKKS